MNEKWDILFMNQLEIYSLNPELGLWMIFYINGSEKMEICSIFLLVCSKFLLDL